ncbi:beta strand repeat-containing protein, partial [Gilliamella sp. B3892]|uniref:beta strand repeat-containing protein n=2 Tax=Gilliamella TaxID=1193503 RepID=UPI00226AC30F
SVIDNALNTNILDHQIFEQAQLNDTARQPTTVENTHQHVDINQPVQDSAKQHEKQIDNPHFGHDNTTAVNATIDKQEVITSANTPVDNNIDDHLNQQSQQADHADLATADKDITPPKTISIYEPNLTLPDNSLWIVNKDTDKNYIIETDPNFTQRKKWLSSDYMLSRLKADPDSVLKRLGDGYYEQQLIKEQIVGLTGHRYLQGYENDLAQYQALMDAGISFANQYGIAPGVELSAEQMKALTTDMVLLVKKQVVINNQAIDVLVPQVYIVNRTELSHDGALIAGDNVFIKGQTLNSSGLINAKKDIQLSGNNVTNSGTVFGERVAIDAKNDITNYGKLVGDKLVYLSADNDINLLSSTRTQIRGNNVTTNIDQASIIQVNNGNIVIDAGHDIHAKAGWIINNADTGNTSLHAGHDIRFTAAEIEEKLDLGGGKHYRKSHEHNVVGSEISAANNVTLSAGHDIDAKTVDISAGKQLGLYADNDIAIGTSSERFELDEFHKSSSKGFLNKTTTTTQTQINNTTEKGSQLYGDSVTIAAGNNVSVTGSQVVGTHDVNLKASNNIDIDAAEESYYRKQET